MPKVSLFVMIVDDPGIYCSTSFDRFRILDGEGLSIYTIDKDVG